MQLFGFDAACLDHVRQELVFRHLARDAHGEGLEWTGSLPRVAQTNSRHAEPTDAGGEIVSAPQHLALGETPNIAARLQALAPVNAVVISAVTARLVRGTFALEDLGPYALPGVAEPLAVSRVRGLLATPSRDEEFYTNGVPLLVGREEESGLLRRRWEQSKAGLGQVVFISGEAGIGKSALVEQLRAQVRADGLPRIAFRCSPYHTTSALSPVITHLERLLQFEPDDPPTTRLAKLEAGLRPSGLPLAEVVPLFAGLLSVPLPAERYAALTLTPPQQKQRTLDALVAWMAAEAERQPVLVAWEDLHWADPSTLELLGLFIEQAPTAPMFHLLTFRPDFVPPWPPRSHMTPLTLHRLEHPQVEAMIARLARGKALPVEVVEHIVSKTDGVPLFIEELSKMLLESALLREEAEHYALIQARWPQSPFPPRCTTRSWPAWTGIRAVFTCVYYSVWKTLDARLRGHDRRGVIPANAGIQDFVHATANRSNVDQGLRGPGSGPGLYACPRVVPTGR